MSEGEDKDDRQHDPSEQKLRKAREKGDIPRSAEATTAMAYLGFLGAFTLACVAFVPAWLSLAQRTLGGEALPESADGLVRSLGLLSALAVLGATAIPAALVVVGLVIQRGLVFTPSRLAPDLKRLDPFRNAAQKFGRNGLVTFAISLAKLAGVSIGGLLLFATLGEAIAQAARMGATAWVEALPVLIRRVLLLALAVALVFAGVDLLWKRFDFRRRNRMTRKEVEDEHKDSEGDPHLKAARRQKAVDLALGSMLADVERADVVIVNPTHYAVALEWKRGSGRAPVCLAKGVDEVAARIRQRARDHRVPVWSDPPARVRCTRQSGSGTRSSPPSSAPSPLRSASPRRCAPRQGGATMASLREPRHDARAERNGTCFIDGGKASGQTAAHGLARPLPSLGHRGSSESRKPGPCRKHRS